MAIWGLLSSGNCLGPAALMTNSAESIFIGRLNQESGDRSQKGETDIIPTPEY